GSRFTSSRGGATWPPGTSPPRRPSRMKRCSDGSGGTTMRRAAILLTTSLGLLLALTSAWSAAPQKGDPKPPREPDVIFVPTPYEVVDKMLELADVRKGEILYDLGCGDGRIPVRAAQKFGIRTFGWDINPVRVKES